VSTRLVSPRSGPPVRSTLSSGGVFFINRKDELAAIDTAGAAVRAHTSCKRDGAATSDPTTRRNYIFGHSSDPDREISIALLFAVIAGKPAAS